MLDAAEGITAGSEASCRIDWDRRYAHMRYHTALHIVDGIVHKSYKGKITGGQIYSDRSRMDFDVPGMDRALAEQIIERSQQVADEGRNVVQKFLSKDEALAIPELARTVPGASLLSGLEEIRVIDIEGFDMQLDGGTHVANTREVGKIQLSKYENNGQHNKRVSIVLSQV
jgi:misacylated tRNA(Ala) deacylase